MVYNNNYERDTVLNKPLTREERKEKATLIAEVIQKTANDAKLKSEEVQLKERDNLVKDRQGKLLLGAITDQCFRTKSRRRLARQLTFLIKKYGIPSSLTLFHQIGLFY